MTRSTFSNIKLFSDIYQCCPSASWCMALAEWLSSLDEEPLALQVFLAQRAVETLWVVVVVQSLHPPVTSFYREPAVNTLGSEQFIPIFLAVGQSILKVERGVGEYFATVSTGEAFRVKGFAHRFQTVLSFHFSLGVFRNFAKVPFSSKVPLLLTFMVRHG